ncbi:MAG: hypothetical protein QXK24_02110 [Ignisphaera sp.]
MSEQVRERYDRSLFPIITNEISSGTVVWDKRKAFLSAEQTATGSEQSIPHNLGVVPTKVIVIPTGSPETYAALSISQGTHTSTAIKVTVTSGWKYVVYAEA